MKVEMVMPQMGESIAEATISKWLKKEGDLVKKDETILEISTDKVDSEIPAPAAGIIKEIRFQEGAVVAVKAVIAVIETEGAAAGRAAEETPPPAAAAGHPAKPEKPQAAPAAVSPIESPPVSSQKFLSPLVKSLVEKHGIPHEELNRIQGSGQGGRINKEDLLSYVQSRGAAPRPAKTAAPEPVRVDWDVDDTKVIVMDNMRQLIAEHMVRSKQTSPHVYSVQEVDVTTISRYRARHKQEFQDSQGFSLSFTPFFLEAAVRGLLQFPYLNASVDGKKIILKKHVNLGCAVALGNSGLIVPVIRQAEEKNFVGLARGLNDLATRARAKKLSPDEVKGGTFTVTNPGVFGTIIGTPIINQPQVAILCLGAIKKRPVVIDDMIAVREICYLTLSYDHRIVDGSMAGQYLAFVSEYLQNWDMQRPVY